MSPVETLRRVWRLLDRRRRWQLGGLQLLSLLMGLSTLGGIAAVLPFFAVLADPRGIGAHPLLAWAYRVGGFHDESAFVLALGAGFVAMTILASAVNFLGARAIEHFAQRLAADFHVALFEEYLHRGVEFHAVSHSAQLQNNVIVECRRLAVGAVQSGLTLVSSLTTCLLIALSVLYVSPWIAAGAALLFGGAYAGIYLLARRRLAANGAMLTRRVAEQGQLVAESLGAVREILVRGNQQYFVARFRATCDAIARAISANGTLAQAPRYVLECITAAALIGAALALRGGGNGLWLAQLGFLALASYRMVPALQVGFTALARLKADSAGFGRIADDLRLAAHVQLPRDAAWAARPARAIVLSNVSFRYAPHLPPALCGVTLHIRAGVMVGIVGANGAGKTTLADLILGLIAPQSGTLEVDGIEVTEANRAQWRASTAYLPQHPLLLDATVAQNVAFGIPASAIDRDRLERVSRLAGLHEFVGGLPAGYDERVGERGVRLSGGQRQKIGLARALYADAQLLVLDEATGALDGLSEREALESIAASRGHRTTLVITHRAAALRQCGQIIELDAGVVAASGTVAELAGHSQHLRRMLGT